MNELRRSTPLRLLAWLFLLAFFVEQGASLAAEAQSESKSSYAAARLHGARPLSGRFLPDPLQSVALPGPGTEPPLLDTHVADAPPADRRDAPPTSVVWRAEYPRGPPRVA